MKIGEIKIGVPRSEIKTFISPCHNTNVVTIKNIIGIPKMTKISYVLKQMYKMYVIKSITTVAFRILIINHLYMNNTNNDSMCQQWNLSNPTQQGTREMCQIVQDVRIFRFYFC